MRHNNGLIFGVGLALGLCVSLLVDFSGPRHLKTRQLRRSVEPELSVPNETRRRLISAEAVFNTLGEVMERSCFEDTGWKSGLKPDRLDLLQHVNSDVPAAIQTGSKKGMLLGHSLFEDRTLIVPEDCEEVEVIVTQSGSGRCLLLAETSSAHAYHITRHVRNGDKWALVSRIKEANQRMPGESTRKRAHALVVRLLSKIDSVNAALEPLLAEAAKSTAPEYALTMGAESKGAVLIMCINSGNLDLLFNFLRSAHAREIDLRNLVVFAADAVVDRALRAAGVAVFRHEALGDFSPQAARSYGDHTFVEMMWLKTTCVYLVNALGYDLLFQDADLFWWKDPWVYFAHRPDIDSFWMDDGARTSRFAPLYPNTGYYLIRANRRTQLYNAQLLGMYDAVLAWQSHQAVVSQLLAEHQSLHAHTVQILDKELFASGKQLHHNRPLFDLIAKGESLPYCFHMCWTAGKVDKLKFLKQEKLWYLEKECDLQPLLQASERDDAKRVRKCATGS